MNCINCNILLTDENWNISRKKRNYKICKFCIQRDNNKRYSKNKNKYLLNYKNNRQSIKLQVFQYYGNCCQICQESNLKYLSIDHLEGSGRQHRKSVLRTDSGSAFYRWVLIHKPNNLRLLCFNCNCSRLTENSIRVDLKSQVFQKYGNKCVSCDCTSQKFLTIDHINNQGAQHRKEIGSDIYTWLIKNNFPKDNFQILCFNCNYAKRGEK